MDTSIGILDYIKQDSEDTIMSGINRVVYRSTASISIKKPKIFKITKNKSNNKQKKWGFLQFSNCKGRR